MIRSKSTFSDKKGLTLVELILAVTVFAIIVPQILSFLFTVMKAFTSYEASIQLERTNEEMLTRIYLKLCSCKRLFQNIPSDLSYLERLDLSTSPTVLTASRLPKIEETGSLSAATTGFVSSSVGNSLFFASNDSTQILENIADSSNSTHTVRIDLYRFYYYYLTPENPKTIYDKKSYRLIEWKSIQYADYSQLMSIPDSTKRANTVKALYNNKIYFAWNASAPLPTNAFFSLTADGAILPLSNHKIQLSVWSNLTNIVTGIMAGGYRYGVSPNTAGWTKAPKVVPQYATADGSFPGGFEVVIVGPSSGRKVLLRSVLVAQGSMPNIIGSEQQIVCNTKDLW